MNNLPSYIDSKKILLLEDNPGDAKLTAIVLSETEFSDFELVHKELLADTLKALENDSFAAVLIDLNLPDSRGLETLQQLINRFPNQNVIVMTGEEDKMTGVQAVQMGAQDFLKKENLNEESLAKILRFSIERARILKRLEEAQRIAHIGNWEFDKPSGKFIASDEVYRIFGLEPRSIKDDGDIKANPFPQEHLNKLNVWFDKILHGEEFHQDLKIVTEDNSIRFVHMRADAMVDEDENVVRITGILQDITERKLAEKESLENQALYQDIFSQSKDAIYIADETGQITQHNQATLDLLDYTKEELETFNFVNAYKNPEDRNRLINEIYSKHFVKDFEVELKQKNGAIRYCLITASLMVTDDFKGYHGIIRDITERKRAEELQKANEIAERAKEMREQLLASVSHEMRTPMNAILNMTRLMLKTPLNQEQNEFLSDMEMSSINLLGIINDILEISKIQFGGITFKEEEVDLREFLQSLMNVVGQTTNKNINLEVNIDPKINKTIYCDPLRLNQIITNLTFNSIKFTEEGYVRVNVNRLEETEKDFLLQFEVEDSGIGMPEDKLELIFESFMQITHDSKKLYGGTGLGLSIVKRLVEMQSGQIGVESTLGKGSKFTIVLRYKKGDKATVRPKVIADKIELKTDDTVRILLVEDHKLNQIVATKTIQKEWDNVEIVIADNGKIGVQKLKENHFDLILMDIQMPIMDGYEATAYIRKEFTGYKQSIPIIAMTAHANIAHSDRYKEFGMDDIVVKPFEPQDLFDKIATYVNKKKIDNSSTTEKEINMNDGYKYIDLSYTELMADGDDGMKKVLLGLLLDEPMQEILKMQTLAVDKNWKELKGVSHKMKSTLPYVGNEELIETNKLIEQLAIIEHGNQHCSQVMQTFEKGSISQEEYDAVLKEQSERKTHFETFRTSLKFLNLVPAGNDVPAIEDFNIYELIDSLQNLFEKALFELKYEYGQLN